MLYMSLFWKVHKEYKVYLRENQHMEKKNNESLCKKQFNEYLHYLKRKILILKIISHLRIFRIKNNFRGLYLIIFF